MMKRLLVCFIALFILTGCDVTYTINIDDDFSESVEVSSNDPYENENILRFDFNYPAYSDADAISEEGDKVDGTEYYEYSYEGVFKAQYEFGKTYSRSNAAKYCFPSFKYKAAHESSITTKKDISCFNYEPALETLTINIVTDKEVISHNADLVAGNKYTWKFTKNDTKKTIDFKYIDPNYKDKKKDENDDNDKSVISSKLLLIILSLFLCFLAIFGIIIFRNKN